MKDEKVFLQTILECIVKIETYTNSGKEEFMRSELVQDAVFRNLEIIGEATKRVSQGIKEQHQDFPFPSTMVTRTFTPKVSKVKLVVLI